MAEPVPVDYDPFAARPSPPAPPAPPAEEPFPPKQMDYYLGDEKQTIQLPDVTIPTFEPPKPKRTPVPVDYDPFAKAPAEPPAAEPGFGSSYGIVRGAVQGLGGTIGGYGGTLDVFNTLAEGAPDSTAAKLAAELHAAQQKIGTGYERQEPSFTDVGGVGEAWTYAMESLGQGLGSMVAPIAGGILGGTVGNVPGAIIGAGATGITLGIGDMNNALMEDAGVKEALASGRISKKQAATIALLGGGAIGALDSFGAFRASGLGKDVIQAELTKRVVRGIKEGIFDEGGTEALQEIISQTLQGVTGGNADLVNRAISVVDATFGGILGGGTVGGVSGALRAPPPQPPGQQANTQQANTQTGSQPTGGPGSPTGTSTPGGPAPGPAPQPAKTPAAQTAPAAQGTPVVTGVDPSIAAAQQQTPPQPERKPPPVKWIDTPRGRMPAPTPPAFDTNIPPVYPRGAPAPTPTDTTVTVLGNSDVAPDHAAALGGVSPGQQPVTEATPYLAKTNAQRAAERTERRQVLDEDRAKALGVPVVSETAPAPAGEAVEVEVDEDYSKDEDEGVIPEPLEPYTDPETGQEVVDQQEMAQRQQLDDILRQSASGLNAPETGPQRASFLENLLAQSRANAAASSQEQLQPEIQSDIVTVPEGPLPAVVAAPPGEAAMRQESSAPAPTPAGLRPLEGEILPPQQLPAEQAPRLEQLPDANRRALARGIADNVRLNIQAQQDTVFESPDTNAIVDAVAQELALRMPPGTAPRAYASEAVPAAVEMVRSYLGQVEETRARMAQEEEVAQGQRAVEEAQRRRVEGKPQERARRGKHREKTAEELEHESAQSMRRAVKAAREAGVVDEDLEDWTRARKQYLQAHRAAGARSDAAVREVVTAPYTKLMEEAKQRRIDKQKAKETAEAEAKAKLPAVVPKPGTAPAVVKRAQKGPSKEDQAVTQTVENFPEFSFTGLNTQAQITKAGRKYQVALANALKTALGGKKAPERIDFSQSSPAMNFVRFIYNAAKGGSAESGFNDVFDVWSAMKALKTNDIEGLKGLISSETLGGGQVESLDSVQAAEDAANKHGLGPLIDYEPPVETRTPPEEQPSEEPALPGEVRRTTGEKVIREAQKGFWWRRQANGPFDKFLNLLQRMHSKRLVDLVGDINVVFMTDEGLRNVYAAQGHPTRSAPAGVFFAPSRKGRALHGHEPVIVINSDYWNNTSATRRLAIINHEMTHAATDYALRNNLHGTRQIVSRMRQSMEKQLKERGLWNTLTHDQRYAFNNDLGNADLEFIAEAFSSEAFQVLMTQLEVPLDIRKAIGWLPTDKAPTWWDIFVRAVANAIRLFDRSSPRGVNYLEQVLRLHPVTMQSLAEQNTLFNEDYYSRELSRQQREDDEGSLEYTMAEMANVFDGMKSKMRNATYNISAWNVWNKLATTDELKRRVADIVGTIDNKFSELADIFVGTGQRKEHFREKGAQIINDLAQYAYRNPAGAEAMSESMHDSSVHQVDPRKTAAQQKISKAGARDEARRVALPIETAKYNALDAEAKALFDRIADHYTDMLDEQQKLTVEAIAAGIMRHPGKTLPAGEDAASIAQWVLSGEIDRGLANQTQRDKDLHVALGKGIKTLKGAKSLRKVKGIYVPFVRQGSQLFTARKPVAPPAGSVGQVETSHGVEIVFKDRKDMDAYVRQAIAAGEVAPDIVIRWIDPLTGATTQKQADYIDKATGVHIFPEQRFVVTVQNRILEMGDNRDQLEQLRKGYEAQGYAVTDIIDKGDFLSQDSPLTPGHIAAMLRSVAQLPHSDGIKSVANAAIVMSYARQLVGTRAQQRKLPRLSVAGFQRDMLSSLNIMNGVLAGNLASLESAPRVTELRQALEEDFNSRRIQGKGGLDSQKYQRMIKELFNRMDNTSAAVAAANDGWYGTLSKNIMDVSFMSHLMSVAYSVVNGTQPYTMGYPVLAHHIGDMAAMGAINRAMWGLGAGRVWGRGLYETGRMTVANIGRFPARPYSYFNDTRDKVSKMRYGAANVLAIDKLKARGYWASAGLELPTTGEIGRTVLGKAADRTVAVARQLPEAVEVVNRTVMMIAAVEGGKRVFGMTDEQAADFAVNVTVQSQGGYAAENNPVFMSNRWLKAPLQFKKYPLLYGQLYVRAMYQMMNLSSDAATRKAAFKMVARMSAMTAAFAGVTGLPFMELVKLWALASSALGGEDDWEDYENDMQVWLADTLKWATGSDGSRAAAEAVIRGAPRLAGVDLHQRMANHLLTFGSPRKMDEAHVKAWMFDMIAGAPGGMVGDVLKAASKDEIDWQKAIPWPKFITDILKAQELYTEGTVNKDTGQQYAEPVGIGEAIGQGLGFRPVSSARQWEPGGSGMVSEEKGETRAERQRMMQRWRSKASPAEKGEYFRSEIREWNREHKDPRDRIDMGDLQKSIRTEKQRARERKREMAQ